MADEVTERQLRSLLDAQTALRKRAEEIARQARAALERVAEALCPEAVDRARQANPSGLASFSPDDLAALIIREVGSRLRRLEVAGAAGQSLEAALADARAQADRLREEVAALRRELASERAARQAAETRAAALERMAERITAPASPPPPPMPSSSPMPPSPSPTADADDERPPASPAPEVAVRPELLPAWMQEWAATRFFDRDRAALWILGSTGVARRMDASALVARAFGVEPGSGSVARAFDRLRKLELIDVVEAQTADERGSATWHLYRLSQKGEDAFRLLFGQEPAPSQTTRLLNRHKSPEHVLLILAAADLFTAAGWKADPLPDPVPLPDGSRYEPDLVVVGEAETLFVECERATIKDEAVRAGKWRRYYQATHGNLCVVVPDAKALEAIRSEILYWLSAQGLRKFRLRMTALASATPQNLWSYVREQE
jgi:flavin-binding protein dodecin